MLCWTSFGIRSGVLILSDFHFLTEVKDFYAINVVFFTLINFLQMLKIKTWLTETLLRVTNSELKNICDETLFEMRRSGEVILFNSKEF